MSENLDKEENILQEESEENPNCAVVNGCHVFLEYNKEGECKPTKLCNFNAKVEAEEIRDDGQEHKTTLTVVGVSNKGVPFPRIRIDSSMFWGLNWIIPKWGVTPLIEPGAITRDRLRYAIQAESKDRKSITIHTNLGWKNIEREWNFLHAGGAIGPRGFRDDIVVDPEEGNLHDFILPTPVKASDLMSVIRSSLKLVDLGPSQITYPLLSATYRAPLNEVLPADFSISLVGSTGVFKTSISALFQAHFGTGFNEKRIAGSWSSTANSNERQAFLAKDVLFGVDDFVPDVNSDREADRFMRAQGNKQGRGRMRSDGTLRPSNYPRGIILSTGEQQFKGQSLRSRMLTLELSKGDIQEDKLTRAQEELTFATYAKCMSSYLRWLAPQIDELKKTLPSRQRELRNLCETASEHKRTPDIAANLGVGLELFLKFAKESRAIDEEAEKSFWRDGWKAICTSADMQSEHLEDEDPCIQFIDLITSAFVSGLAHLREARADIAPHDCKRWGWRSDNGSNHYPMGDCIGWVYNNEIWLQPDSAFAVAQKIAGSQKTMIPISKDTLWKRLAQQKIITISSGEKKNLPKKLVVGRGRHRVAVFPNKEIFSSAPLAPEAPVLGGGEDVLANNQVEGTWNLH